MSGGSFNYACYHIEELAGHMEDPELDELMADVGKLAHDLEWYVDGDICEDTYRKTVDAFKAKWFKADRNKRIEKYIKEVCAETENKLLRMCELPGNGFQKDECPESDLDDWMKYTE